MLALGVMTPPAPEWTSFEEDSSPYARSVMNRKFLDIEYGSGFSTHHIAPLTE
jgi:hypothetical protein